MGTGTGTGGSLTAGWVAAPAKLTVSLRILRRRADGYHELEAEMVSLDLADRLWIDPDDEGLTLTAAPEVRATGLAVGPDNLVNRALGALGRRAGVRLHKRIPVQGGLGGGSTDAAAVLRWAGCDDLALAARLGSDVPFCVAGGRALVSGLGERVAPRPFLPRTFVLLLPPFGMDTAAVYRAWDRLTGGREAPAAGGARSATDEPATDEPATDEPATGCNDLTEAALLVEPRLVPWRDRLGDLTGARPVLAGSGSTWFVEGEAAAAVAEGRPWLELGTERGRLITARAVPTGWEGAGAESD